MREPRDYEAPLCAEVGGDHWFPDKDVPESLGQGNIRIAKSICGKCRHRVECAEWGLHNERFGIWGGVTELERRYLRKQLNIIIKEGKSA